MKSVEEMVEQTYQYDKNLKKNLIEEICYLKRIICSWRRVSGDGNCFYRSAIFSWVEYLIFNKKIDILKIVISHIYSKFNQNYRNTKQLPLTLQMQFIGKEKDVTLIILEIIIRQLMNDKIELAYITLLKAFNVSKAFDKIMIFYLRYSLYEFISENKNKLFNKDFPVLLGNLLPEKYETEEGKFLFEDYFLNDLLKFYSFGEKIAIFLTPYVLKVNLNVVFYYFGKECDIENKFFSSFLENKDKNLDTISVLYLKAHYDVCYLKDYFKHFSSLLKIYSEIEGNHCYVVNMNDIKNLNIIINNIDPFDPAKSLIFNRKLFLKKQKDIKNNVNLIENKIKNINKNNFIIENIKGNHSINQCFICLKQLNREKIYKKDILLCGCEFTLCSKECENSYNNYFCLFLRALPFNINITCGICNKIIDRTVIIKNIRIENDKIKEAIKNSILKYFDNYCLGCLRNIENNSNYKSLTCKCPEVSKILDEKKFRHKVCFNCKKTFDGNCKICNLYHFRIVQK